MATWVSHLRVADYFLNKLEVSEAEFIVGNIGPDCGIPSEDKSSFIPPYNVTHWTISGSKSDINPEDFFNKYLLDTESINNKQFSFYLGYYIHLLTDIEFSRIIARPKMEKFADELSKDSKFIFVMKKDWYDIDRLFLRDNPEFNSFKVFAAIDEFPNVYLEYYSETALFERIKYITKFYETYSGELDRNYPYLTKEEMDIFIEEAVRNIYLVVKDKDLM